MNTASQLLSGSGAGPRARAGLRWLLLVLVLVWLLRRCVWMPALVLGDSMLPTLHPGQLAAVSKLAYWHRPPQRGDLVVIRTRQELLVKRIIALPGEEVAVTNGAVYIARRHLPEPYVVFCQPSNIVPDRIPPGRFLVAGDNRCDGAFLLVAAHRIVGRLRVIGSSVANRGQGETSEPTLYPANGHSMARRGLLVAL